MRANNELCSASGGSGAEQFNELPVDEYDLLRS